MSPPPLQLSMGEKAACLILAYETGEGAGSCCRPDWPWAWVGARVRLTEVSCPCFPSAASYPCLPPSLPFPVRRSSAQGRAGVFPRHMEAPSAACPVSSAKMLQGQAEAELPHAVPWDGAPWATSDSKGGGGGGKDWKRLWGKRQKLGGVERGAEAVGSWEWEDAGGGHGTRRLQGEEAGGAEARGPPDPTRQPLLSLL